MDVFDSLKESLILGDGEIELETCKLGRITENLITVEIYTLIGTYNLPIIRFGI